MSNFIKNMYIKSVYCKPPFKDTGNKELYISKKHLNITFLKMCQDQKN